MKWIDTHTHLFLSDFREDLSQVLQTAIHAGITRMLMPNVDERTLPRMMDLHASHPEHCYPMIGLHPTAVKESFMPVLYQIQAYLDEDPCWGIGETGIDLYRDRTFLEQQVESFRIHIQMAKEHQLPLIIHARNSFEEIFEVMDREADDQLKGVFHAFTGNMDQAVHILDYGFKLGIGGILTYKNSGLKDVVRQIDPAQLVLETDAPYLSPVPHRGKRNEPAYLVHTAGYLAEIYGLPLEDIARITTRTAAELFHLPTH